MPVTVGLLSWAGISLGFFGLQMLMRERPEFVGQPMRITQAELIQESPQLVVRKVSDDISVIKPAQPELSDVRFDMNGRRDYRGLRTVRDMSGQFRALYVLTNSFEEPTFALFKCPHPRTEGDSQGLLAGELRLQASANGIQENTTNAWFWSGTIETRGSVNLEVSYQVTSLKGITYKVVAQDGNQVKQLRVTVHRKDIAAMRFESGDGTKRPTDETVVWERRNFLAPDFFSAHIEEGRNLYASLSQLLEMGPIISLLFLLSVSAVILVRQKVTAIQMLTIAAGYAFYFPLMLYLSANFSFHWALLIAVVVPGVLLVNYGRWLVGGKLGLIGGIVFLVFYQVFPTLAAFAGWHRGMVLLCLGIITLAVLINLQNRALRQAHSTVAVLALFALPVSIGRTQVQVILPAELASKVVETKRETNAQVALEPTQYQARQEASHFRVEVRVPFHVLRPGDNALPLFNLPVYLQESKIEADESNLARLVAMTNRLSLIAERIGSGSLRLVYRVPIENSEGKQRAEIPLVVGLSGNLRLDSARNNIEILTGRLWTKTVADKTVSYEVGVAAEESLVLEWREQGGDPTLASEKQGEGAKEFYGIGLTRAQNLTIINSDSSCTHFAEFELPVSQSDEFRIRLPPKARLISVSVNGTEVSSPTLEEQLCRIRLPTRDAQRTSHRLSFRMGCPPVRLGFVGVAELALPEVFQTVGTLEWVVALPNGFETQLISSGLEKQKSQPDLGRFGDYGRILKSHPHTFLAKDLVPPGSLNLSLRYRQVIPGIYQTRSE